jgi:hypothetical protein
VSSWWPRSTAPPSPLLQSCRHAVSHTARGPPCLGLSPPLGALSAPSTLKPSTGLMSESSAPSTPPMMRLSRPRPAGLVALQSTGAAPCQRISWRLLFQAGWAAAPA